MTIATGHNVTGAAPTDCRLRRGVPQLAVVWGRRRVGKTFLLTHFAEGKRVVYFTATRQDSAERQLFRLTERMREQLGSAVDDLLAAPFRDWEAAFRFLIRLAETDPLLVVIACSSTSGECLKTHAGNMPRSSRVTENYPEK